MSSCFTLKAEIHLVGISLQHFNISWGADLCEKGENSFSAPQKWDCDRKLMANVLLATPMSALSIFLTSICVACQNSFHLASPRFLVTHLWGIFKSIPGTSIWFVVAERNYSDRFTSSTHCTYLHVSSSTSFYIHVSSVSSTLLSPLISPPLS